MSRKGENIYKRKDGRWEGRFIKSRSHSGKAIYGYVYAKTYREVKTKLITAINSNQSDALCFYQDDSELFTPVALAWFESKKAQIKESTSNKYSNLIHSYILPQFGNEYLSNISYDLIEAKCNKLLASGGKKGQGLSRKTIADILSVMRNILRFSMRKGKKIACDPFALQVRQQPQDMRVLSRSEQESLYRFIYSNLQPCNIGILICLFSGIRVGEICALRWEDISFEDRTMKISKTMQRIQNKSGIGKRTKIEITSPKSSCSIRTIPLPDTLLEVLKSHYPGKDGYILTNDPILFIEPRTLQNRFKKVLQSCDIEDANFHALRHTFATRCVEVGFDIKSLSEILGHASVNITLNRYVHPSMELKKENMERLSSLFTVK